MSTPKGLSIVCVALALTLSLFVGLYSSPVSAQRVELNNEPSIPLQIISVTPDVRENGKVFAGAQIALQNVGDKTCVAFVVSLTLHFADGQVRRVAIAEDRIDHGFRDEVRGIEPNTTHVAGSRSQIQVQSGATIKNITAKVDYIELPGGITFGSDPDRFKRQFTMSRFVRQVERKRLLRLYEEKGFGALLEDLRRP